MDETVPGDRAGATGAPRTGAVISGRSLLLRLLVCIVTIVTMSIGGAWLMHAAIDPAADRIDGAAAQEMSPDDDDSGRLAGFGNGLRAVTPNVRPAASR